MGGGTPAALVIRGPSVYCRVTPLGAVVVILSVGAEDDRILGRSHPAGGVPQELGLPLLFRSIDTSADWDYAISRNSG